jgi:acyl carrier protein
MLEKLLQICREANPAIPDNPEAKLIDEGYVDSFGAFMILTSIEMDFGITIPESEIKYDNLKSINSMIELINRLLLDDSEQKTSF